ncbi:type I-E CRISPR-associated protein Cas7/Cse4/CasC [Cellulomonas bogoriensis]|uniref:CRISPR-associated protein CasC n=1 Tax=Cellulomonas bogoriensis 69B4 = DSM 16987 TaxID=1386082 RepID=A0A0A0C107_9CELL|nr:type I-E CRISPR-associated protein Cas7/Cse4/CasC [Cellulomonas bogoriensis]KGM13637.1 CRISPR-associated protein CasC [Cellulomonas bogoriensis 69B4 = DSM 16987]
MTRTIVDVHILQSVPPSNINRDDTGSPKTAIYGGVRRARVSSQAWKRATRLAFDSLLDRSELGVRTKRVVELVVERATELDPSVAENAADLAASVVRSTGLKLEKVTRTKSSGAESVNAETGYLVFVSRLQVDRLARAVLEIAAADDPDAALKALKGKSLLDTAHSVDLALFGRMVADVSDLNVDACAQVAHALSVHAVDNEYDYFTAVDDVKQQSEDEDAGAGMIGTVEFNSSTLYRYATVDVDRLAESLGDASATTRAVQAFVQAFAESMPTGKQNTFANRTLPDAVLVMVRDTQPVNLVGAFEEPVTAVRGEPRLGVAAARLADRAREVADTFGQVPVAGWAVALGNARQGLEGAEGGAVGEWTTLPGLYEQLGTTVAGRVGDLP